jgi:hypothetical protein
MNGPYPGEPCPECHQDEHNVDSTCKKLWFETGYAYGLHDGANDMEQEDPWALRIAELEGPDE